MLRKAPAPIERHSILLFKGDFTRLQEIAGRMGAGKLVRNMVRNFILKTERRTEEKLPLPSGIDVEDIPDLKEIIG